MYTNKFKET